MTMGTLRASWRDAIARTCACSVTRHAFAKCMIASEEHCFWKQRASYRTGSRPGSLIAIQLTTCRRCSLVTNFRNGRFAPQRRCPRPPLHRLCRGNCCSRILGRDPPQPLVSVGGKRSGLQPSTGISRVRSTRRHREFEHSSERYAQGPNTLVMPAKGPRTAPTQAPLDAWYLYATRRAPFKRSSP
jgi:hypothetical protein